MGGTWGYWITRMSASHTTNMCGTQGMGPEVVDKFIYIMMGICGNAQALNSGIWLMSCNSWSIDPKSLLLSLV
ncbi:hypothetical protein Syun_023299 [Stephania yunnanensis]|uniref:Uncharacterized protein n=1 Tax=Stephania yunnanensis TaxID=152371 RepID=A0AAP0FMD9_9MAGN